MILNKDLYSLIVKEAQENFIDPDLAIAIVGTESSYNTYAHRYEPHWDYLYKTHDFAKRLGLSLESEIQAQKTSWGLMQIMGSVARELGFRGYLTELVSPPTGAEWGCKKLLDLKKKYSNELDVISAYNQGSPIKDKVDPKLYRNQMYVNKVMKTLTELRAVK